MRLKELAILHKRVIHDNWKDVSANEVELENIWVMKYPYDVLESVCSDCFSSPDAGITQNDLVCLEGLDVKYPDNVVS